MVDWDYDNFFVGAHNAFGVVFTMIHAAYVQKHRPAEATICLVLM